MIINLIETYIVNLDNIIPKPEYYEDEMKECADELDRLKSELEGLMKAKKHFVYIIINTGIGFSENENGIHLYPIFYFNFFLIHFIILVFLSITLLPVNAPLLPSIYIFSILFFTC